MEKYEVLDRVADDLLREISGEIPCKIHIYGGDFLDREYVAKTICSKLDSFVSRGRSPVDGFYSVDLDFLKNKNSRD